MSREHKDIVLPFSKSLLILNSVIFGLSLLLVILKIESSSMTQSSPKILLFAASVLFFSTTRSFIFTQRHLIVKVFGIPIRKIPLSEVRQVLYLPKWNNGQRTIDEGIFFITLSGCIRFLPEYDRVVSFCWRHPIRSMYVYVPKGKEKAYMDALEQLLGEGIVE